MLICGAPGSGKTSMMVSLLQEKQASRKAFDQVFVAMPPSSARSLKKNTFDGHDKMFDDLDYDTMESILEHTRESTKEKENSLSCYHRRFRGGIERQRYSTPTQGTHLEQAPFAYLDLDPRTELRIGTASA